MLCLCTIHGLIGHFNIKRIYQLKPWFKFSLIYIFFYLRAYMEPVRTMRYSIVHSQFCVHGCSDCCYDLVYISRQYRHTLKIHFTFQILLTKHDLSTYYKCVFSFFVTKLSLMTHITIIAHSLEVVDAVIGESL